MLLDTIKTIQQNEIQRAFNWEFILPQIDGAPDNIEISSYVQDVKFGDYSIGTPYSQYLGAFKTYGANSMDIAPVTLSILSTSNGKVIQYFNAWRDLIVSTRGAYFFAKSNYVKMCYCILYNRQGDSAIQYRLINCFPKTFPAHDLSYGSNEFVKFNVSLVVDAVEMM